MVDRGIVVTSPFNYDGRSLEIVSTELDPADLRRWALYWDRIDWPTNNLIHIESGQREVEVLQSEGVLTRTDVQVGGSGDLGRGHLAAQYVAFHQHVQDSPGAWSLGQNMAQLRVPTKDLSATAGELELQRALPTPAEDVPIEEVLAFKEKREDELLRLRIAMGDLYQNIASSEDAQRAIVDAKDEIEAAIRDLDQTLNESVSGSFLSSIKVGLDFSPGDTFFKTIAGAGAAQFGVPFELGAAAGAAISCLNFSIVEGSGPDDLPDGVRDYAYLGHARRALDAE